MNKPAPSWERLLARRADEKQDAAAFVFRGEGRAADATLTYGDLYTRAVAVADLLGEFRALGERVLLLLPWGRDFVVAVYGCWLAGVAAGCAAAGDCGVGTKVASSHDGGFRIRVRRKDVACARRDRAAPESLKPTRPREQRQGRVSAIVEQYVRQTSGLSKSWPYGAR